MSLQINIQRPILGGPLLVFTKFIQNRRYSANSCGFTYLNHTDYGNKVIINVTRLLDEHVIAVLKTDNTGN